MPCAVLSAAPAAATCVCCTQLCTVMYCVLKYSLCLASLAYGCACHAAHYLAILTWCPAVFGDSRQVQAQKVCSEVMPSSRRHQPSLPWIATRHHLKSVPLGAVQAQKVCCALALYPRGCSSYAVFSQLARYPAVCSQPARGGRPLDSPPPKPTLPPACVCSTSSAFYA